MQISTATLRAMVALAAIPAAAAAAPAASEKVIYSFLTTGNDGRQPLGALIDVKGKLIGTNQVGGANGWGDVFQVTKAGAEKLLYSFKFVPDGAQPGAGLLNVAGTLYGTTTIAGAHGQGAIFKLTAAGSESVLYSFLGAPNDGANPNGDLIKVGSDFYGTTTGGGSKSDGTIFKVSASGQETVLHSFTGPPGDGSAPYAGLVNINGTLYGTTSTGGASYLGTVFSISPKGQYAVIHSFSGADGSTPRGTLINVGGNMVGTTRFGGTGNAAGTVFQMTTEGAESVIYSFQSYNDGAQPYGAVIDVGGTYYGATLAGGAHSIGTVFAVTPAGAEQVLHTFAGGTTDGSEPNAGLTQVGKSLYGTTELGGTNGVGTVYSVTP